MRFTVQVTHTDNERSRVLGPLRCFVEDHSFLVVDEVQSPREAKFVAETWVASRLDLSGEGMVLGSRVL